MISFYADLRAKFGDDPVAAARWMVRWLRQRDACRDAPGGVVGSDDFTVRAMSYHVSRVLEGFGDDPYVNPLDEAIAAIASFADGDVLAMSQHAVAAALAMNEGHDPRGVDYLAPRWGAYLANAAWGGEASDPEDGPDRRVLRFVPSSAPA